MGGRKEGKKRQWIHHPGVIEVKKRGQKDAYNQAAIPLPKHKGKEAPDYLRITYSEHHRNLVERLTG